MKKALYILFSLSIILASCGAPKTVTKDSKLKEQNDIENNISFVNTSTLDQVVSQAMQKFFNEKLNININNKVYDTDKPVDPETGKPPLKEETNIDLSKETNETTAEQSTTQKKEITASQLQDKSKDKSKVETSEKTETKTGFSDFQKTLMIVGALAIIGLILFIISKLK